MLATGAVPGSLQDHLTEALATAESRYEQIEAAARTASRRAAELGSKQAKTLDSGTAARRRQAKDAISKLRKQVTHPNRRRYATPPGWGVGFVAIEACGYVNQAINWLGVFAEVEISPLESPRWRWVVRKSKMPETAREQVVSLVSEARTAHEQAKDLIEAVRLGRERFRFAERDEDSSALELALGNADLRTALSEKWIETAELSIDSQEQFAANPRAGEGARALELSFVVLDSLLDTTTLVIDTLELRLELDARQIFDR